jgi:endoglucanase
MAIHYKERSDFILFEILNEPHGISTSDWGNIQNQAINAIRAHDSKHTIVVGGSSTLILNLRTCRFIRH